MESWTGERGRTKHRSPTQVLSLFFTSNAIYIPNGGKITLMQANLSALKPLHLQIALLISLTPLKLGSSLNSASTHVLNPAVGHVSKEVQLDLPVGSGPASEEPSALL